MSRVGLLLLGLRLAAPLRAVPARPRVPVSGQGGRLALLVPVRPPPLGAARADARRGPGAGPGARPRTALSPALSRLLCPFPGLPPSEDRSPSHVPRRKRREASSGGAAGLIGQREAVTFPPEQVWGV